MQNTMRVETMTTLTTAAAAVTHHHLLEAITIQLKEKASFSTFE
jgi:hypothetical protein